METYNLKNMIGGWFIGNFDPSLVKTKEVEVAVKNYKAGDVEECHYHKISTEYTVIIKGKVKMSGIEYDEGTILKILPMESSDFLAVTDVSTVVVKFPSVTNDKYITNKI